MTGLRWKEQGDFSSGDFQMTYSRGKETQRGVALLLDKQTSQAVMEVDFCNDELVLVRLHGIPVDVVAIVVYMLTSDHEGEFEERLKKYKGKDYL